MVAVSLDSANPRVHEKLRGVPGCFEQTVCGIKEALPYFGSEGVVVNSVLFPGKEEHLESMPAFLRSIGVSEWSIGPYKDMRQAGGYGDTVQLKDSLTRITERAQAAGLNVFLADELRRLDKENFYDGLFVRSLEEETYVVRLSPDATCSRGRECFGPSGDALVWDQIEEPNVFLRRILSEVGVTF